MVASRELKTGEQERRGEVATRGGVYATRAFILTAAFSEIFRMLSSCRFQTRFAPPWDGLNTIPCSSFADPWRFNRIQTIQLSVVRLRSAIIPSSRVILLVCARRSVLNSQNSSRRLAWLPERLRAWRNIRVVYFRRSALAKRDRPLQRHLQIVFLSQRLLHRQPPTCLLC